MHFSAEREYRARRLAVGASIGRSLRLAAARYGVVAAVAWAVALSGLGGGVATAADSKVLWRSGPDYVRIESQDEMPRGSTADNDHPARLSPEDLRTVLGALLFAPAGDDLEPVFRGPDLARIVGPIALGLASADPDQDVTFAISQTRPRCN